ncbi:MAG: iron-sulfur cluster repair di-iron protein [Chryseolinea sp.]
MSTYMNTLEGNGLTVAQLAIAHPGALAVFTKYNIDYCCGGNRSLVDACHRIGLDPDVILAEIAEALPPDNVHALKPETWSSGLLIDFIIQNHHSYIKSVTPELEALLDKVCDRHGNDCLELLKVRECFLDLSEELLLHMEKEERVLFPLIKRMEANNDEAMYYERMIRGPISAMEDEHETAGDLIKQIRYLSNNYTPPDFACPTFQITYRKLKEFDSDLMRHIHLENNILFERFKNLPAPSACSI